MAAKSNLNGDVYLWLIKVIESCTTPLQLIGARRMVTLFSNRLPFELMTTLHRDLRDRLSIQNTPDLHSPQGYTREDSLPMSMGDVTPEKDPPPGVVTAPMSMGDSGWKSASPVEKKFWNMKHKRNGWKTNPDKGYYGPLS